MLIELTGHPCSGKSFMISKSSHFSNVLIKKKSLIYFYKLFLLTFFYFFSNKLLREIYFLVLIDDYSFYEKIKLILNITDKYYVHNSIKNLNKTIIIDEGVTHILFNILCTENVKVWNSFINNDIFCRLPKPDTLILVKIDENTQKNRLKERGHKRLNNIDKFVKVTRKISKYIELNYKGNFRIVSNIVDLNNILNNDE